MRRLRLSTRYAAVRVAEFPSLKAKKMLAILEREPLRYREKPGKKRKGSHRHLVSSNGYPNIGFWAHDKDTLKGSVVKDILVKQVGLSDDEARKLL
jgi:predicted RNA binding protein YcfA (HicA-like mRNA interferase family)